MSKFDETNTNGYSAAELNELNRRFERLATERKSYLWEATEMEFKSAMDQVAERVLVEFDTARRCTQTPQESGLGKG